MAGAAGASAEPRGRAADVRSVVATAPGKLILIGEHAVVYGHPAVIAAVGLRLRVSMRGAAGAEGVTIRLEPPGHVERVSWPAIRAHAEAARRRWERYGARTPGAAPMRPEGAADPAFLVKVALGEAAARLPEDATPLEVAVESELPVGRGLGSSAAVGLAVVAAYFGFRGHDAPDTELESAALDVERRQHGHPSGGDGATVLRGGIVGVRRGADGLEVTPLRARARHLSRFRAYDTGAPAETTGEMVMGVRARREREPEPVDAVLGRMGAQVERLREALTGGSDDAAPVHAALRAYERGLEALGVVPEPARRLIRRIEAEGGAAKISGAGAFTPGTDALPGAGVLLVYHEDPDTLAARPFLRALRPLDARLGARGLEVRCPA